MTDPNNVTGRDGYIVAKALIWALEHAKTRPEHEREWSDEEDMAKILETRFAFSSLAVRAERDFRTAFGCDHREDPSDTTLEETLAEMDRL